MRTYAEKRNTAKQPTAAKCAISDSTCRAKPSGELHFHLHRTIGNNAAQRLVEADRQDVEVGSTIVDAARFGGDFNRTPPQGKTPKVLQEKLAISTPEDPAEQEADRAAEQVMRMPHEVGSSSAAAQRYANTTLQRVCEECMDERSEELEGKAVGSDTEPIDGHVLSKIQAVQGGGSPLPNPSRAFFEQRFGHDFTAVRIHTDSRAAELARNVKARAFTLGQDIVFGLGEYSPESGHGKHMLAHELAHVVQQGRTQQQQIQRLAVTQHALAKGTCGQRNVQWVFSLDKPAPADGYIVQRIDKSEYVNKCPDVAIGPPAPLPAYWEAWFVKKGDKLDWTTVRDSWTDGNTRPARPGTNGSDTAMGTIKFFTKTTTGDLGDFGTAPADPKSPWGPGKVTTSGALPSTPTEPSWWGGAAVEGPTNRNVWASWNCCDADTKKHSFDLTVKP